MTALKKIELQNKLNFKVTEVKINSTNEVNLFFSYDAEYIGIGVEKTNLWQLYSLIDSVKIKYPTKILRNKNGFWEWDKNYRNCEVIDLLNFDKFANERIILDLKNIFETNLTDFSKKVKNDFKEFIINFENKINDEF
jgi:hypothetical protein